MAFGWMVADGYRVVCGNGYESDMYLCRERANEIARRAAALYPDVSVTIRHISDESGRYQPTRNFERTEEYLSRVHHDWTADGKMVESFR
jgi:hypothetical protein